MIRFCLLESATDKKWKIKRHLALEIQFGNFYRMYDLVTFSRLYFYPEDFDRGW